MNIKILLFSLITFPLTAIGLVTVLNPYDDLSPEMTVYSYTDDYYPQDQCACPCEDYRIFP